MHTKYKSRTKLGLQTGIRYTKNRFCTAGRARMPVNL